MNRLRNLIKEILLESLESFKDATADISFDHDKKDPYFKTDLGRENVKKARAVKQAWAAHSDREFFKDLIKIHWFSNQHMFYHRKSPVNIWLSLAINFFKIPHDNEISVCGYRRDKDIPIVLGWGRLGVEVQGWTTLAANEMDSIASGYHGSSDTDEDSEALRARIAKGPITSFRNDGSSPSFKKNVSRRPSRFGDPYAVDQYALDANSFKTRLADSYSPGNELIIDHWTPIRWVIEQEYLTSLMRRPNLEKMNALLSLIEKSNLPLVDLSLTTIDTKELRTALDKKLKTDMKRIAAP